VSNLPFTPIVTLDAVTETAPIVTSTALPLASDTRGDCARYFDGAEILNENISGTSFANACEFAAAVWALSVDDLEMWNPGLGNVTNGECTMKKDVRYCAKLIFADPPPDPVVPDYDFDVRVNKPPSPSSLSLSLSLNPTLSDDKWRLIILIEVYSLRCERLANSPFVQDGAIENCTQFADAYPDWDW
jgi:hypothetical protein